MGVAPKLGGRGQQITVPEYPVENLATMPVMPLIVPANGSVQHGHKHSRASRLHGGNCMP